MNAGGMVLGDDDGDGLTERLITALHTEALILADEARGYFEGPGREDRDALGLSDRVSFSCESLKITTRLMHVIAWLMTRRGEGLRRAKGLPRRPLGETVGSEAAVLDALPVTARQLIGASRDLHDRVRRLDDMMRELPDERAVDGPARSLLQRLEQML